MQVLFVLTNITRQVDRYTSTPTLYNNTIKTISLFNIKASHYLQQLDGKAVDASFT